MRLLAALAALAFLGQVNWAYPADRLITVMGKNGAPVILQQRGDNIYDLAGKPLGTITESTNTIKPLPGTKLPDSITPNARIRELVPVSPQPAATPRPGMQPNTPRYPR